MPAFLAALDIRSPTQRYSSLIHCKEGAQEDDGRLIELEGACLLMAWAGEAASTAS